MLLIDLPRPAVAGRLTLLKKVVLPESYGMGEDSGEVVPGVVAGESRKFFEIREKSDSLPELMEEVDEADLREAISGAFNAFTLVVEISSVGREISSRLIVPGAYLTLPSRAGAALLWLSLGRFVRARAIDMVEEAVWIQ